MIGTIIIVIFLCVFLYSVVTPNNKEKIEVYEEVLDVDAKRTTPLVKSKKETRFFKKVAFTVIAAAILWFGVSYLKQPDPIKFDGTEMKWLLSHQESAIAISKQLKEQGINIPPSHLLASWGVQTDFGRRTKPRLRSTKIEMEALTKMYLTNGLSSRADSFVQGYNLTTLDHDE